MAEEDTKPQEEEETKDDVDQETEDEITEEDSSSEEPKESEPDEQFEKRFPQLKGETLEEYTQRLEEAYDKSTTEGKRLYEELETFRGEQLEKIAKTDPAETQNIDESFGDTYARTQVRKENRKAFESFVENHSELNTDPALAERMKRKVGLLAKTAFEEEGEVPDMDELLRGAWAMLSPAGSDIDSRSDLKERTGGVKTSGVKKRDKKPLFSPDQIAAAKKMYPGKSDKELAALLSQYTK